MISRDEHSDGSERFPGGESPPKARELKQGVGERGSRAGRLIGQGADELDGEGVSAGKIAQVEIAPKVGRGVLEISVANGGPPLREVDAPAALVLPASAPGERVAR